MVFVQLSACMREKKVCGTFLNRPLYLHIIDLER